MCVAFCNEQIIKLGVRMPTEFISLLFIKVNEDIQVKSCSFFSRFVLFLMLFVDNINGMILIKRNEIEAQMKKNNIRNAFCANI